MPTGKPDLPDSRIVPVVEEIDHSIESLIVNEGSEFGVGGMHTKLSAARHATSFGAACVIVNGTVDGIIDQVARGDFEGTLFLSHGERRAGDSRRHWMVTTREKGIIYVDAGAAKALAKSGGSLLPVGVKAVQGSFRRGEMVVCVDQQGREIARGLVNYDATELPGLLGRSTVELGPDYAKEVVHRDDLVLL